VIFGTLCNLRPYTPDDDAARLAQIAGDFEVARWLTHRFPHPYTVGDARAWLATASVESPVNSFAITVDGELAGGIGIRPHTGEASGVAIFGYWLGRAYWSRGIATEAARLLVAHAFETRRLRRLEAQVAAPNLASARVLEKSGFIREGMLREAFVERDGTVQDAALYGLLRTDRAAVGSSVAGGV
jgi:ribosomal-protein-alanine N-acetyltransferase